MRFEVGDRVRFDGQIGRIIGWHYDEGNVWEVELGNDTYDCYDEDLEVLWS